MDATVSPPSTSPSGQGIKSIRETRFIVDHCGNADPNAFVVAAGDGHGWPGEDWPRFGKPARLVHTTLR
jgi:hypothetical protein